jgi:hypothetical protein
MRERVSSPTARLTLGIAICICRHPARALPENRKLACKSFRLFSARWSYLSSP